MSQQNRLTRRELLHAMGLGTGYLALATPLTMLIESIVCGVVNKAYGAVNDKKYLFCLLEGAQPRWTMDLFLTPYNTSAFIGNMNLATKYVANGGRYTDATYATVPYTDYLGRTINVPWMWQFSVPKAGGGTRPMNELLNYMIQIRGLNINQSQHEAAQALRMHPLGAKQSLTAVAADNGSSYIPGINTMVSQYRFASKKGLTSVNIPNDGDMVQTLMTPFVSQANSTFKTNKAAIAATLEGATKALDTLAIGKDSNAQALADNRTSAKGLLENGIVGMATYWTPAVAKYKDLIARSISPQRATTPGIDDLPIGTLDTANRNHSYDVTNLICDQQDVRNMIVSSTELNYMAEHFALAQFVLTNDISNSVAISPDNIRGVYNANGVYNYVTFDEHNTGGMTSVFFNTIFNRALSACMLELIDQLKAKNMFQNTVIDIASEFGRITRADGTGSDHGSQGGSSALYTGALQNGPLVIGNIRKDGNDGGSGHGTWGYGANYASLNEILHGGHMAATVAYLLGAPSPVTSAASLVKTGTTGIVPVYPEVPGQV